MSPVLAHQGGWDEILLAGVLVLMMLGFSRLRRRRHERTPSPAAHPNACAYCGAALEPDAERCSACGFRVVAPPAG